MGMANGACMFIWQKKTVQCMCNNARSCVAGEGDEEIGSMGAVVCWPRAVR